MPPVSAIRPLNRAGESGDSVWWVAGLGEGGVLTVVGGLEFGGRDVTAGFVEPPVVEPVDVFQGGDLDLLRGRRIQPVDATPVCKDSSCSLSASAGVFQPSVLRGRLLSAMATASISSALHLARSVPLGKYCLSRPLVFSFVGRCHGLCGSAK